MRIATGNLRALVRHFVAYSRWRVIVLVALMLLAALSEGVGLLLLLPLLAIIGLSGDGRAADSAAAVANGAANLVGMTLSLEFVLGLFVVLVAVRQVIVFSSARMAADMRAGYVGAIRKEFFAVLGDTDWRFLTGERLHQISQVLLTDCWRIGQAALNLTRIVSSFVLLAAHTVVAMTLSPGLALSLLGSITVLTFLFGSRLGVLREKGGRLSAIHTDVLRLIQNYVDNLRVAKMAGAMSRIRNDFSVRMDELGAEISGFSKATESMRMALQLVAAVVVAAALVVAVRIFGVSGPELLLLVLIAARFIPRLSDLSQNAHMVAFDLPAFEHAYRVFTDCRSHREPVVCDESQLQLSRSVSLREVTVVARDGSGKKLLDSVSLQLRKGEMIAITGPSGAGKSTLADVLSGLLLPDAGELSIDGKRISGATFGAWRQRVGYVPQTTALLQDTVANNLNWTLPSPADDVAIERVLRCAELSRRINELEQGLNTTVDRRERMFSGGERQRLAIARELLRGPDVIILDEATSGLDPATEARVLENIRHYYPDLTVVLVTHRDTAVQRVDRVFEMLHGRIAMVERGAAKSC